MTHDQFAHWLKLQEKQILLLERIARSIEALAPSQKAPNYRKDIKSFNSFDWSSIGATVEKSDRFGVATVIWQGFRYIRRSPENAYGAAIFFTRCVGKDPEGRNKYERLITFEPVEDIKVRPVSREVEALI